MTARRSRARRAPCYGALRRARAHRRFSTTNKDANRGEVPPSGQCDATVLVVEDDPNVRELVVKMLANFGYRTSVARTGPEALAFLENGGAIDLLLSNVVMPAGMSGTELARAAQRLRPDLKILLTSGYTGVEPEPGVMGEFSFIAKPYRAPVLGRKLREILAAPPIGRLRRRLLMAFLEIDCW